MAISITALWAACFLFTHTFRLLNSALGSADTLWAYAAICLTNSSFVYSCLPETKGRTLEEIEMSRRTGRQQKIECMHMKIPCSFGCLAYHPADKRNHIAHEISRVRDASSLGLEGAVPPSEESVLIPTRCHREQRSALSSNEFSISLIHTGCTHQFESSANACIAFHWAV